MKKKSDMRKEYDIRGGKRGKFYGKVKGYRIITENPGSGGELGEGTDPLNAENLPPALSGIGLGCAQKEIDGLLKLLVSRGIATVGQLLSIATSKRMEMIKNIYRAEEGRSPSNFEMVANLVVLAGRDSEDEAIERLKANISFLKVGQEMKKRA